MHEVKNTIFCETKMKQLHSLGQNLVGFVLDWRWTGSGDERQLYFGWRMASEVLHVLFVICKSGFYGLA